MARPPTLVLETNLYIPLDMLPIAAPIPVTIPIKAALVPSNALANTCAEADKTLDAASFNPPEDPPTTLPAAEPAAALLAVFPPNPVPNLPRLGSISSKLFLTSSAPRLSIPIAPSGPSPNNLTILLKFISFIIPNSFSIKTAAVPVITH